MCVVFDYAAEQNIAFFVFTVGLGQPDCIDE